MDDEHAALDFDVVLPNGNEKELIDAAISLGFKGIVLLSNDMNYPKKFSTLRIIKEIRVMFGLLIKNTNDLHRSNGFDYTFADAERKFFESKVDYIIDSELSDRRDSFHYKSTRLNQVHAELARANEQTLVFSFRNLLSDKKVYGRMSQNALLAKKYSISKSVFSMAKTPLEMRSRNVLNALGAVLGIN